MMPKKLRRKNTVGDKILPDEEKRETVTKPVPSPSNDFGNLKAIFEGKSSRQLLKKHAKRKHRRKSNTHIELELVTPNSEAATTAETSNPTSC